MVEKNDAKKSLGILLFYVVILCALCIIAFFLGWMAYPVLCLGILCLTLAVGALISRRWSRRISQYFLGGFGIGALILILTFWVMFANFSRLAPTILFLIFFLLGIAYFFFMPLDELYHTIRVFWKKNWGKIGLLLLFLLLFGLVTYKPLEERAGFYSVPNGKGVTVFSRSDDLTVSIEGGIVSSVDDCRFFFDPSIYAIKKSCAVSLRLLDEQAKIDFSVPGDVDITLTFLNTDPSEYDFFVNGRLVSLSTGYAQQSWIGNILSGGEELEWFKATLVRGGFIFAQKGYSLSLPFLAGEQKTILIQPKSDISSDFTFFAMSDTHSNPDIFVPALIDMSSQSPDFVVRNGDMTNLGLSAEYAFFASIADSLPFRSFFTVGNHDIYNNGKLNYATFLGSEIYSFVHKGVKFIFLDTSTGVIGTSQFSWLESQLQSDDYNQVFVFSHMPPREFSQTGFDEKEYLVDDLKNHIYLKNESDRLMDLMRLYNVDYFVAGHSHIPATYQDGKTKYITLGVLGGAYVDGARSNYWKFSLEDGEIFAEEIPVENGYYAGQWEGYFLNLKVFLSAMIFSNGITLTVLLFLLILVFIVRTGFLVKQREKKQERNQEKKDI